MNGSVKAIQKEKNWRRRKFELASLRRSISQCTHYYCAPWYALPWGSTNRAHPVSYYHWITSPISLVPDCLIFIYRVFVQTAEC